MRVRVREDDLQETLVAIRELADSACNLANLAARLTRGSPDAEAVEASRAALEASTKAAESVFALDDAMRAAEDPGAALWLCVEAIESSQRAVREARGAVEVALGLAMAHPRTPTA